MRPQPHRSEVPSAREVNFMTQNIVYFSTKVQYKNALMHYKTQGKYKGKHKGKHKTLVCPCIKVRKEKGKGRKREKEKEEKNFGGT